MDKIIIKNLKVYAYHGVNDFEKQNGQIFLIDVKLKFKSLSKPCFSDNLNVTVSYSKVIKTVSKVAAEKKYNLLETLAEKIEVGENISEKFDLNDVQVEIKVERI